MLIETDEGNFTNLDFVERVSINKDKDGNKVAKLFDAENNVISSKTFWSADVLRHFEYALTSTHVPVSGFTLVSLIADGHGIYYADVYETPIIAFRVSDHARMPEPITLDDFAAMDTVGRWGIRFPSGKVMEPCRGDYDSPAAFLESVRNEVAKEDRKAQRKIKAKAR